MAFPAPSDLSPSFTTLVPVIMILVLKELPDFWEAGLIDRKHCDSCCERGLCRWREGAEFYLKTWGRESMLVLRPDFLVNITIKAKKFK